jgi:hypothetical protein
MFDLGYYFSAGTNEDQTAVGLRDQSAANGNAAYSGSNPHFMQPTYGACQDFEPYRRSDLYVPSHRQGPLRLHHKPDMNRRRGNRSGCEARFAARELKANTAT